MGWADELVAAAPSGAQASAPAPAPQSWADEMAQSAGYVPPPGPPAPNHGFGSLSEWEHQLGLTARAAVTGVTGIPALLGNTLNSGVNLGIDGYNSLTNSNVRHLPMPGQMIQNGLDQVLPTPRNAQERIVQDATSAGFGLVPTMAAGQLMAKSAAPVTQAIGRTLTAVPANQVVAASSAGASGGGAREAGLNPYWQFLASLGGGFTGSLSSATAGSLATRLKSALFDPEVQPQLAPGAVDAVMSDTPLPASPQAQTTLAQRTAALLTGSPGASPAAAARAADANALGMKLTLGQSTRDPGLFAQEQNWRGTEAGAPLLNRLQQQNGQLGTALESTVGSGGEAYADGQTVINALKGIDDSMRGQISGAYKAAEQSSGAKFNVPLQGVAQDYANVMQNFGDKVPSGVQNNFNALGLLKGTQQKIFGVDDAENLLKVINANKSNDPATNTALSQLSQSVKNAVLSADDQGGVFSVPRQMAAQRFALHDQVPALADAASGAIAPEKFTQQYLVNGSVDQVKGLANLLQTQNPTAMSAVQGQIGNMLKRAAFGENPAGDNVFTPARYAAALRNFGGTAKLSAVYGPEGTDDLYGIGRVGSYINSKPAFSPVNSSNTGSAILDMMSEIPLVGSATKAAIKNQMIARALKGDLSNTGAPAVTGQQLGKALAGSTIVPSVTTKQNDMTQSIGGP